jgi:hypothetical protein
MLLVGAKAAEELGGEAASEQTETEDAAAGVEQEASTEAEQIAIQEDAGDTAAE